jgi:dienelactone hydrolase
VGRPAFRPLFQVAQGVLPYPTDLYLNGSTDGTVKAPVLAVTPNVSSLNSLDGFGVNTEMTIRFSKKVDPATLAAPGGIVILETTQRTVVASASTIGRVPVGVRRVLVPGVDYTVGLSTASDADGTVISIKPLKPLTPSSGGALTGAPAGLVDQSGVGYVVLVTSAVKSVDGDVAAADDEFQLILQAINNPANPANPGANCSTLGNATLAGVCQLTAPSLAIAQAAGIPLSAIALSFSFTTESTRDTLVQMANAVLTGTAPSLAAQVIRNPVTGVDLSVKDVLDPTGQNPELKGIASIYEGTVTLPYYQPTPADATPTSPAPPLTAQWQAASAVSLVPGQAGSTRITRYNPVPAARHTVSVPVLISVPNKVARPATGWPVVIFVHGITGNRSNALAIAEAYAGVGYAVAAIDLPLHGITPTDPAAALRIPGVAERTFDMDYVNNATGMPGPDGQVDGSGANFIQVTSPVTSRDNLRQAVIDELSLASALASPTSVLVTDTGPVLGAFDPAHIQLSGQSLGGIVGATVASLPSAIRSFALSVPGGGIADLLLQSATFGPPIGGAVAAKLGQDTFLFRRMFGDAQAAVDAGDPLNHIAIAAQNKPLLVHKVLNDQVIPNSATDRLLGLSGLTKYTTVGFYQGGGYVTFTAGAHDSLLDPTVNSNVTEEMQVEFAVFASRNGSAFEIGDGTYIQNP